MGRLVAYKTMEVTLPDFRGEEKNTLYIIGNGFDLFHELKTSFLNFREWLVNNRYTDYIEILEAAFPSLKDGELLLWKDFETAIGDTEPINIHQNLFQGEDDMLYDKEIQERVHNRIKPYLESIPNRLRDWIKKVDLEGVREKVTLSSDSKYLSFNYTRLLEEVYWISSTTNLIHIHGVLNDKAPLITGHRNFFSEQEFFDNANEEISCQLIAEDLNRLKKPVENIIQQYKSFFNNLAEIKNIIVFGISLSDIDLPYFTEVIHHVHDEAHWYFVCYDDKAKQRYKKLIQIYNDSFEYTIGYSIYRKKILPQNCSFINIQ